MSNELRGKRVAALVEQGFEQSELDEPRQALEAAGATVHVVSPQSGKVLGWERKHWGHEVSVDRPLEAASADDYNALLLPGGVMSPDRLRTNHQAIAFVKAFVDAGKPIASICHGPWTLIEAGAVEGRTVTSWPSLRTDLSNAGAHWVDQEVVNDNGLVTSRKPDDIPAFNRTMIEEFAEVRDSRDRRELTGAARR
ncbi:MAG TPA: type 1 glutamine amidotransferase domain-containing protein [Vicinamibacterales bacterium]|nr:type 1 glutamine amidotransferase domain-containing protein [Vicinamibacterales bacterium]